MHHIAKLTVLACAALLWLGGCATPKHTDLLVFGTNTSLGISVKGDATSSAGVDIGYHRQEVVLMPLYVNAADSQYKQASAPALADAKYQGSDTEARKDTYSVLASFGAKGGAAAGKADVTIAQYFATGLAARTLALAGGALVTTSDAGAGQPISAAAISAEKAADIRATVAGLNAKIGQIADKVSDAAGKVDSAKLKQAFTDIAIAPDEEGQKAITTRDLLVQELSKPRYDSHLDKILKNLSP